MKTKPASEVTDADRPFITARGNADGTVTLYYPGDTIPLMPEPPAAPACPQSVTMRQARLALLAMGKLAAVTAAINALPSPQREAAQIEWEYSGEVHRDRALVRSLAPALGLDDAALDGLFNAAALL